MPRLAIALLLGSTCGLLGCGEATTAPAPPVRDVELGLKEIGELYRYLHDQKIRLPVKPTDLEEFEGTLPAALPLLREGEIIVVWNVGYAANSSQVLAYEKATPTGGGKVVLRNGTVKTMTAEQFRTAKH